MSEFKDLLEKWSRDGSLRYPKWPREVPLVPSFDKIDESDAQTTYAFAPPLAPPIQGLKSVLGNSGLNLGSLVKYLPAIGTGLWVFLRTRDQAPWLDTLNPITRKPYAGGAEYDWVRKLTEDQIKELVTLYQGTPQGGTITIAPPNPTGCSDENLRKFADFAFAALIPYYKESVGAFLDKTGDLRDKTKPAFKKSWILQELVCALLLVVDSNCNLINMALGRHPQLSKEDIDDTIGINLLDDPHAEEMGIARLRQQFTAITTLQKNWATLLVYVTQDPCPFSGFRGRSHNCSGQLIQFAKEFKLAYKSSSPNLCVVRFRSKDVVNLIEELEKGVGIVRRTRVHP